MERSGAPAQSRIRNTVHEVGGSDFVKRGYDSRVTVSDLLLCVLAVARFHGLEIDGYLILELRCAPPQALCCHPLRGLRQSNNARSTCSGLPSVCLTRLHVGHCVEFISEICIFTLSISLFSSRESARRIRAIQREIECWARKADKSAG